MTRPPFLTVENATKVYRMGEVDVPALRDASLDVREGEFLAIVGASGSGKSTLLNLIGGMDRPTSGKVLFDGTDLARASDRELTLYRRHVVGFVFQFYNLVPTLTAVENVEVAAVLAREPLEPREVLGRLGLADRAGHFPAQLSGGEQQRVALARALAGNPRLLLCDEPTGALDVETGKQILDLLSGVAREFHKTVVLITHNSAIATLADRVAHIRDGAIVSLRENERPLTVEEVSW